MTPSTMTRLMSHAAKQRRACDGSPSRKANSKPIN